METDQRLRACVGAEAHTETACKRLGARTRTPARECVRPGGAARLRRRGLAEGDCTASSDGRDNRRRHICTHRPLGSTMQERAVSFIVEQYARRLVVMPDGPAAVPRLAFRKKARNASAAHALLPVSLQTPLLNTTPAALPGIYKMPTCQHFAC